MLRFTCLLIFAVILSSRLAYSQAGVYAQDQSYLHWRSIENEFVQVIYPEEMKDQAVQTAEYIRYYAQYVGLSYGIIKPKKFSLILRSHFAEPNGFVALAPRRSEWHSMGAYTSITSTLNWYQILAIHEYRHVNQFDNYLKGSVSVLDYLWGDTGVALASTFSLQPWYFEGDAVYAETRYSDAGRGRQPSFLAHLKATLLSAEGIPSYDQFLSGTYSKPLPNHYVYGYILVTEAYKRFGDQVWAKVINEVTDFPTPWALESAFKKITGVRFKDFYQETFEKLKAEWNIDRKERWQKQDYRSEMNAKTIGKARYYISSDLDSLAKLRVKVDGTDKALTEISYNPELTRMDFSPDYGVITEFRPHWRWGQKSDSDLVLIDLKSGKQKTLTQDERYYNPRFTADGRGILAAHFKDSKTWEIILLDLEGRILKRLEIPGLDLYEASELSPNLLAVIVADKEGRKSIIKATFEQGQVGEILSSSRNAILGLSANAKGLVSFEAQVNGKQEILVYKDQDQSIVQCSDATIEASMSFLADQGDTLDYTEVEPYGTRLYSKALKDCKAIDKAILVDYRYLSERAQDNFSQLPRLALPSRDNTKIEKDEYKGQSYSRFDSRAFTPHSWNFFVGRGLGLEIQTNNYLNDFGMTIAAGKDPEENSPYVVGQIDFRMFYPVLSLIATRSDRELDVRYSLLKWTWKESSLGARIALPYIRRQGVYTTTSEVSYQHESLKTWRYYLGDYKLLIRDGNYSLGTAAFNLSWTKDSSYRALMPELGFVLNIEQKNATPKLEQGAKHTAQSFASLKLYSPTFLPNHGLRLSLSGERNTNGMRGYEFAAPILENNAYLLSRGYSYIPLDRFTKGSVDYAMPLFYPDSNLGMWIYLKRISLNLFVDSTRIYYLDQKLIAESYGAEAYFESKLFRVLPISFGFRAFHRRADKRSGNELFLATQLANF